MFLFRKPTMFLFLAWRYLTWREKSSFTRFAMRISVFAVATGAAALTSALMITNGTKKAIYNKIKALTGHTSFYRADGQKINLKDFGGLPLPERLENNIFVCPSAVTSVVLKDKNDSFFNVFLKAVDFKSVDQVLDIKRSMEDQANPSAILSNPDTLVVGQGLLEQVGGLARGNMIELSVPEFKSKTSVRLKPVNLKVGGVFHTGLNEFDCGVIFCSLETFWKIYKNEGQVDQFMVRVLTPKRRGWAEGWLQKAFGKSHSQRLLDEISQVNLNLVRTDWKETYKSLISCMELEKNITLLIIFLIALIAMINLSSVLVLQIQAKKRDITIFRVFGLGVAQIKAIFFTIAMVLVAIGTAIGSGISLLCAFFFTSIHPITLPAGYFIDRIFFDINPIYFMAVLLLMLFCGFIASLIPMAWVLKIEVNRGLARD